MKFYIMITSITAAAESGSTVTYTSDHFMFTAVNRTVGNRMASRWTKKMGFRSEDVSFRLATGIEKNTNPIGNHFIPAGR